MNGCLDALALVLPKYRVLCICDDIAKLINALNRKEILICTPVQHNDAFGHRDHHDYQKAHHPTALTNSRTVKGDSTTTADK